MESINCEEIKDELQKLEAETIASTSETSDNSKKKPCSKCGKRYENICRHCKKLNYTIKTTTTFLAKKDKVKKKDIIEKFKLLPISERKLHTKHSDFVKLDQTTSKISEISSSKFSSSSTNLNCEIKRYYHHEQIESKQSNLPSDCKTQ